ncbi:MAG TPA: lipopolysaccharide heptosyltransferase II [Xanthobacteraceae bacterium]
MPGLPASAAQNSGSDRAITPAKIDPRPVLIVPYMWIGDFVRCHSVVALLKAQAPDRPVDFLTVANTAPLLDYLPGVRKGIVWELPRRRLAFGEHRRLAERLRGEGYGQALVMPRTWKAALAPWLAGIPRRTGYLGEARLGLINDLRFGERGLPRMVERCAALALPAGAALPAQWPLPKLAVPAAELARWRQNMNLAPGGRPVVALAPGAVGPSKRWPAAYYGELAASLAAETEVWVLGGPAEAGIAADISAAYPGVRNLTGSDLRQAILALAAADVAVSNDSGLLHVAAALGTPTIGIFGPTSPWHWAPLNPLAAVVQADLALDCRPCHKPACRLGHHRCMREIPATRLGALVRRVLESPAAS